MLLSDKIAPIRFLTLNKYENIQILSYLKNSLIGLQRFISLVFNVFNRLIIIVLGMWTVQWVSSYKYKNIKFVSVRSEINLKLFPFSLYVKLPLNEQKWSRYQFS
jgi:hypothetical protein